MACMLNSESRRLYSWWWDSHITPKNSKWLQENLTDMDSKVKSMIKLIEEDADSFARRAEMYYKKRPELMKLVEELYRAYRALAERYDYATGELRHAQKTLQAAFPDSQPLTLLEDLSSSIDQKNRSLDILVNEKDELHNQNQLAESEVQNLKRAVADLLAEKDSLFVQYQCSLEKLSNADEELNRAIEQYNILDEKANEAEKEVDLLKESLYLLQAEKEAGLNKQMEYLETISDLEEQIKGMEKRAVESEIEGQDLMNKLSRLESENDAGLLQYGKCLEKISLLEKKILVNEEKAKMFSDQATKAESEVEKLKNSLLELTEEKEALRVLYSECLEKSYKLELDLSAAQSDIQRLTLEILNSTKKLENVQEICVRLETSNQSLKMEASELAKKIVLKDQELSQKHEEMEKLESYAKKEHTHHVQVEAALETLQMLYTQSQEEQRNLAMELQKGLQKVQDLEICKSGLEEEMKQAKNDKENMKHTQVEITKMKETKEKLEGELALQLGQCTAMQQEIFGLREEIAELNTSYNSLMSQLELVGMNPESIGSSIKYLQDENSRLKQICEKNVDQEEKIKTVVEKNNDLESSFELLHVEKSAAVLEKTVLLSQLHMITVNMQKLMDQNTVLENSLSTANMEVVHLREKSKGLEDLCELLSNEKSNLVAERSMLATQLENVQKRLEFLEDRFLQFEERYGGLEKDKEMENSRMVELISCLSVEKQEREKRLDDLEKHIHRLHEDNKSKKEEFQEELDKAVIAQFENFMLHKFIKEVDEKNYSLSVENEKHIEASKLADKLISELETEILEQQVEEELLLVEVENLRLGIYQIFLSLEIGSNHGFETSKISVEEIIGNIKELKRSLSKEEDDKQRLLIENTVISTLLQELKSGFRESELQNATLLNVYGTMKDDFLKAKKQNLELVELNENLGLELDMLHEELEEQKNIEENLTSELQERDNEFELWDAEATSFIFDLQISNTRDILFESKVHELTGVCKSLEGETASKDVEIEEMKQKAVVMERENEGLKAQLLAYNPVIGSLKENISSLEQNVFTMANLIVSKTRKSVDMEVKVHPHHESDLELKGSPKSDVDNGISDLIEFQTRIAALEKVIVEDINTIARRESSESDIKLKSAKEEEQKLNKTPKLRGKRYLTLDNLNITKPKPEVAISEARKGVIIRDIPLDQASDGSSSANSRSRSRRGGYSRTDDMMIEQLQIANEVNIIHEPEKNFKKLPYEPQIEDLGVDKLEIQIPNQESTKGKLLQRLSSDAQKLANLKTTVKDLTTRLETGKKGKHKASGFDFETVKEQLQESEETISQLVKVNADSISSIERNPSLAAWVEQDDLWKSSEKIKRVQFEVQKIQYILLKDDGEKKTKGKSRFSRTKSRTTVILRDFIHRGRNNSGRNRKRRLCGCFTPSTTKGDRLKL